MLCVQVAHQLTMKYGKEYADMCRRNGFETVNEQVNSGSEKCCSTVIIRLLQLFSFFCSTMMLFCFQI